MGRSVLLTIKSYLPSSNQVTEIVYKSIIFYLEKIFYSKIIVSKHFYANTRM